MDPQYVCVHVFIVPTGKGKQTLKGGKIILLITSNISTLELKKGVIFITVSPSVLYSLQIFLIHNRSLSLILINTYQGLKALGGLAI